MDHDTLDRVVAAYGSGEALAHALGMNPSTMRRWRARVHSIPDWFWAAVPELLRQRAPDLRRKAKKQQQMADECDALAQEIAGAILHAGVRPPSE